MILVYPATCLEPSLSAHSTFKEICASACMANHHQVCVADFPSVNELMP